MKLTLNEISFLATKFEEKSELSLFSNIKKELLGSEEKSLEQKSILKNGNLESSAKEILDIVATPQRCSRVIVKDNFCVVEKYSYKSDEMLVLAENDNGDFSLEAIDNKGTKLQKVISEISEFSGKSKLKNTGIECLLSSDEMLVLLAIIDLYRKNTLLQYAGSKKDSAFDVSQESVSLEDIVSQLKSPSPNSLLKMIVANYNYKVPEADNVSAHLENLINKACVEKNKEYSLKGEYINFAKSLLIPETLILLESFNLLDGGEVMVTGALCVCAGVRDIASFIFAPDVIELSAISGSQLLQMVENFMNCPDLGINL